MKKVFVFPFILLLASCATVSNRFLVTNLGYEPNEMEENYIYALPKTHLKVSVSYTQKVIIPGPYADYALKLLGIEGVPKGRKEFHSISGYEILSFTEADEDQYFSINVLEGTLSLDRLNWAADKDLILFGDYFSRNRMSYPNPESHISEIPYIDLSMEKNVEMNRQTIYKTLITDTSFVKVPVTTEQLQRKTLERKAQEAANLILEIRTDRYYLTAGQLDPYPQSLDLEAALAGLDRLESEYLSLFIGKEYSSEETIEYDVSPAGSIDDEHIELDIFTEVGGYGQTEGDPITLLIKPSGKSQSIRNLLPQEPEDEAYNRFYYRIPEVVDVFLLKSSQILVKERLSVFQCGAIVNEVISQ